MSNLSFKMCFAGIAYKLLETGDAFVQLNTLSNNAERVKFLYPHFAEIGHKFVKPVPKDFGRASELKVVGNKLFSKGNAKQAINIYNEAIKICPQNNLEGQTLYAILIANRSAVFFDEKQYEQVLNDVAFLKHYGHHPNEDKITTRETKALDALSNSSLLKSLKFNNDGTVKIPLPEELTWTSMNSTYPALSHKLTIKRNKTLGRHVVATQDIDVGEIVAIEKPYASIVYGKFNCIHCALSTNQMYACNKCQALYCSRNCIEKARVYHQYECTIMLTTAEVTENDLLALRLITQRPLQQVLEEEIDSQNERQLGCYKSDDYYNINRLEQHNGKIDLMKLLNRSFMAAFLLKMLKTTEYFGPKTETSKVLTENESLVGGLLLKYLHIICFNGHDIVELQDKNLLNRFTDTEFEHEDSVGLVLYPTLALFSHSCDPSVIITNILNVGVTHAIKTIKTGDVVSSNYGFRYHDTPIEKRKEMTGRCNFTCACQACSENWPTYLYLATNVAVKGICRCGGIINDCLIRSSTCSKCKRNDNGRIMRSMTEIKSKSSNADTLFAAQQYKEAQKLYSEILQKLYSLIAAPSVVIIDAQKHVKQCILYSSNKRFDF